MRTSSIAALILASLVAVNQVDAADKVIPQFADETKSAGIDFTFTGDWQYMVGGGVATFDCNADGFDDVFLAGGTSPSAFYVNRSERGGALKFERQVSGLELSDTVGAYPLDVDSDGITDLLVLRVGESALMRGKGSCQFERANEAWSFTGGDAWWTAAAATWEGANAWPTIALGSYIDRTQEIEPWGSCTENWLERPRADGVGFDKPVPLKPSYCALSMLFTDWNLSGKPSLRIANDREYYTGGQEQMWKLDPGADPTLYTPKDGWKVLKIWGMGIASADVTGDGRPDYFITSMADNKLQTLTDPSAAAMKPDYKDVAFPRGAIAQRPYFGDDLRPSTAWHTQFEDVNNDGLLDLFIAKGNVDRMPDFAAHDPNNLMLQQADGKFMEVGDKAGVANNGVSRGAAMPDFNLDGRVDLIEINRRTPAQLWRNVTTDAGHWIAIKLSQAAPNVDAIGARIEVKVGELLNTREVTVGGGHASGQIGFWHFGLGEASDGQVRVIWPDGSATEWMTVAADQFYSVGRDGAPKPWTPGR